MICLYDLLHLNLVHYTISYYLVGSSCLCVGRDHSTLVGGGQDASVSGVGLLCWLCVGCWISDRFCLPQLMASSLIRPKSPQIKGQERDARLKYSVFGRPTPGTLIPFVLRAASSF